MEEMLQLSLYSTLTIIKIGICVWIFKQCVLGTRAFFKVLHSFIEKED